MIRISSLKNYLKDRIDQNCIMIYKFLPASKYLTIKHM